MINHQLYQLFKSKRVQQSSVELKYRKAEFIKVKAILLGEEKVGKSTFFQLFRVCTKIIVYS